MRIFGICPYLKDIIKNGYCIKLLQLLEYLYNLLGKGATLLNHYSPFYWFYVSFNILQFMISHNWLLSVKILWYLSYKASIKLMQTKTVCSFVILLCDPKSFIRLYVICLLCTGDVYFIWTELIGRQRGSVKFIRLRWISFSEFGLHFEKVHVNES